MILQIKFDLKLMLVMEMAMVIVVIMIESVVVMLMRVIRAITVSWADPKNLYWKGPNRCPPR